MALVAAVLDLETHALLRVEGRVFPFFDVTTTGQVTPSVGPLRITGVGGILNFGVITQTEVP